MQKMEPSSQFTAKALSNWVGREARFKTYFRENSAGRGLTKDDVEAASLGGPHG